MKRNAGIAFVLAGAVLFLASPARANLRAPYRADGYISGGLKIALPPDAVRLVREDMRVVFPAFEGGLSVRDAAVLVELVYVFDASAAAGFDIPVQFVAVDIRDLAARLNDEAVPAVLSRDSAEETECLQRLVAHRRNFMAPLYREFLHGLKADAGAADSKREPGRGLAPAAALDGRPYPSLFVRFPSGGEPGPDFRTAKMTIRLRPGRNALSIRYRQRPYVAETRYGYFSTWPARGFTGFDYLLYPARSWAAAADFRLSVTVEVPYYRGRFLVFPRWDEPQVASNIELNPAKSNPRHLRVLHGEFGRMPSDILTVLVWFDKKAVESLPH